VTCKSCCCSWPVSSYSALEKPKKHAPFLNLPSISKCRGIVSRIFKKLILIQKTNRPRNDLLNGRH